MQIAAGQMDAFDKWLGEHLSKIDAVSKALVKAVILAAGGKVDFTAQQVVDMMEGNVDLRRERTKTGYRLFARARPRCEKCGRWEPEIFHD